MLSNGKREKRAISRIKLLCERARQQYSKLSEIGIESKKQDGDHIKVILVAI